MTQNSESVEPSVGTVQDITERKLAEENIRLINRELQTLTRVITETSHELDAGKILETALDEALRIVGLEGGTVCMLTRDDNLLQKVEQNTSEATKEDLRTNKIRVGECLCGGCAREQKPLILWSRQEVLEFSTREAQRGEDIRFHAAFPLVSKGVTQGVLCVFTYTDVKPSQRSLKLLETLSSHIALTLENARLHECVNDKVKELEEELIEHKQAEEALRESDYAYHTLAKNLPGIVYRVFIRENNRMRFFNKLAEKVTGYGDEELTAGEVFSIETLIVPEDREMVIAEVKRAITKNRSFKVEYRLKHKDGSTRCMLEQGTPIYGKEGQPLYIDGIIFDVTERKEVEEELRRSQAGLETAQAQAKLGNWDLDPTTQKGHWSKEMYRLLDINPSTDPPPYPEFLELIHPEDRQRVQNNHKEAFKGEHPIITEFRGNPARGLNRYFLGTVHSKSNDKGMVTQLFGTLLDITERKQIEEKLRKSEELFRKLVEAEPECVKLLTKENILVDMNPAGLKMIEADSRDQIIGKSFLGIIDPEYRDAFVNLVERVFKGESVILEFSISGLKGTKRWLETHAVPLRDDNGKINLLISIIRDITEHKHAEDERFAFVAREQAALAEAEAARKLDRMKSMFIASTSHELRTPLNSIIGFTSLILDGTSGELNPDQKEQLEIVHSSGKHLLALINDIIDLSMIESGRLKVEVSEFNLRQIVDEAASNLNVTLKEKKLELKVDVVDIKIKSDRTRILQCLINLLSNAIKYTEKGRVEITAKVIDNNLELSVTDTGIGIKTEDIPKLFGPFVRLQSPLTLRTSGTGLGLYLVNKLAKDFLGGDVEVKSELGKGSKFTLHVPVELEGTV